MIDMFGQAHVNQLANLSNMRQEFMTFGQPIEDLYVAMMKQTGASSHQITQLFQGVDIYDKYFLVSDAELSALESTLGQAE